MVKFSISFIFLHAIGFLDFPEYVITWVISLALCMLFIGGPTLDMSTVYMVCGVGEQELP